jgi:hypothetical protein
LSKNEVKEMSQRKYLRRIAQQNMLRAGMEKINKHRDKDGKPIDSVFARNWRDYVNAKAR